MTSSNELPIVKNPDPNKEPSDAMIKDYMRIYGMNFYAAREKARKDAYGGKPPNGFSDWGTYWKCY
jgi:hypothetical protein